MEIKQTVILYHGVEGPVETETPFNVDDVGYSTAADAGMSAGALNSSSAVYDAKPNLAELYE